MKKVILYFSNSRWERIKQRPQHLAEKLSRDYFVIYINPSYTLLDFLASKLKLTPKKVNLSIRNRISFESKNLVVVDLPLVFPLIEIPLIGRLVGLINSFQIEKVLNKLKVKNPDYVWISFPTQYYYVKGLRSQNVIYDVMDEYSLFYKHNYFQKRIEHLHDKLIQKSKLIFVSSLGLKTDAMLNSRVVHLPNAVDIKIFDPIKKYLAPKDIEHIPRPRIVFVGYIGEWINLKLIQRLAKKNIKLSFVLIGPKHVSEGSNTPKNMYYLGVKDYLELPAYISNCEVAIIPFIRNKLTDKVNPVKLYEYLAMLKPVVATRTDELELYERYCSLADSDEEFEDAIKKSLKNKDLNSITRSFIKRNRWENRGETIRSALQQIS